MTKVNISEGWLEGEVLKSSLGGTYHSFKGIPYAAPPVGDLRFKPPQDPKPWDGVRPAKKHEAVSPQVDLFKGEVTPGSEDCLHLNVYSPDLNPSEPLPVLFYIHEGGFISFSGNSDRHGPDFIVNHGVILVTINYRLGILGYLCLDTPDVPGNAGMKDQVAALKWVRKNISNFGGDPDNITIAGQSAGAACVSYHLVSPMSKGLFKRAILAAGSFNCHWALTSEPRLRAELFAAKLGKYTKDDQELYDFYKTVPVSKLIGASAPITSAEELTIKLDIHFKVVDEKQFGNNERFFYKDLMNPKLTSIHKGVEIMMGYTTDEGLISLLMVKDLLYKFNNLYECFLPRDMERGLGENRLSVGKKIKEFYYGGKEITRENMDRLIDFLSCDIEIFPVIQWSKIYSKTNKLYLYEFNLHSERNVHTKIYNKYNVLDIVEGRVTHCDDIMYVFNVDDTPVIKTSKSFDYIHTFTSIWTNFAKGNVNGNLDIVWPTFDAINQEYLFIGEPLAKKSHPRKNEMEFWEDLYKKYYPQGFYYNMS